ncbi:MAG: xylan 1,4-beta-xylosidase [Mogibacterium sp.]|nr:xylan 1,4-beta-xylosidase [Mogibacterium sp.]
MSYSDRFQKVFSQGTMNVTEIWVDTETGVHYLYHCSGYGGGLTALLDRDGKPVVSALMNRTLGGRE